MPVVNFTKYSSWNEISGNHYTSWKVSKYGFFSGPYFPVLGLNAETARERENTDQKNAIFGHFQETLFHFMALVSSCLPLKAYLKFFQGM